MAIPTRLIKRRIKSIRSTGKIMKAMELVAASKMRKAIQLALNTRPYAQQIHEMSDQLRKLVDASRYPYLVGKQAPSDRPLSVLLVVMSSDRGLCGGFNSQLLKKAMEFVRGRENSKLQVVTVGRRAEQRVRRAGIELIASFESIANAPSFERSRPVANLVSQEFLQEKADRIFLSYTTFKSALVQTPIVKQLLPITPEVELVGQKEFATENNESTNDSDILFEPSSDEMLKQLLPRMIDMQLYQAFLESAASEHSARMMAMRSAGDAATEMLDTLTFTLNQARQASITREISEISAGKAAIE